MSNGKIVLGALAGLAIGGILGILLAPEKGSRTRRKILNKGEEYVEDLKDKVVDYLETIKDKYDNAVKDTEQLVRKETKTQEQINKVVS